MRRRESLVFAALFLLSVFASFFNVPAALAFSGAGAGTPINPFKITTCAQLQEIGSDLAASYKIMNNIDCSASMFTPIGNTGPGFTGTLDGGFNTISGINAIELSGHHVGMFRLVNGATVSNLTITDSAVQGESYVGVLTGGTAGFCSIEHVTITNSNAMGLALIGGLAGSLFRCSASDSGTSNTTVNGTNSSGATSEIGGFAGEVNMADVSRSYVLGGGVTANIDDPTQAQYTGGFAGTDGNGANIEDSFTTANVTGHNYVGGMSGRVNDSAYVHAYASGSVTATGSNVGGFAGGLDDGVITDSFSVGSVSGFTAGGFVGVTNAGLPGDIISSYWDVSRSGQADCVGDLQITVDCTGVNVSNAAPNYFFNNHTNAPLNHWDFSTIWRTNATSYPTLQSVPGRPDNVRVTRGDTTLKVMWDPPADTGGSAVTSYDLQWGTDGTTFNNDVSGLSAATLTYTITNLSPSTTYYIQVRANNAKGNGVWLGFITSTVAAAVSSSGSSLGSAATASSTTNAAVTEETPATTAASTPAETSPTTTHNNTQNQNTTDQPQSNNPDLAWLLIIPGGIALVWIAAVIIGKLR